MPGMYRKGEYDLAGCIVGVVDRAKMIDGSRIKRGDVILGLPSNGLHTNGYSLARKIFSRKCGSSRPRSRSRQAFVRRRALARAQKLSAAAREGSAGMIHGLAHITGGGLIDNLPRVLPKNCDAVIETNSWRVPPIFQLLQQKGKVDRAEMYQVFNMGIGMVAIVAGAKE